MFAGREGQVRDGSRSSYLTRKQPDTEALPSLDNFGFLFHFVFCFPLNNSTVLRKGGKDRKVVWGTGRKARKTGKNGKLNSGEYLLR